MAYIGEKASQVTVDTDVTVVPVLLRSVVVTGDGTNSGTVQIKDGTVAAGTNKLLLRAPASGVSAVWTGALRLPSGLGVDVTGTGITACVTYQEE